MFDVVGGRGRKTPGYPIIIKLSQESKADLPPSYPMLPFKSWFSNFMVKEQILF